MARTALITFTRLLETGIDPTAVEENASLVDGNSFAWARNRLLYVANGDATELTVTFPTPGTVGRSALAVSDGSGAVAAGGWKLFGPFGPEYRQPDGSVHVDYTGAAASVTVAVLDANAA